LLVFFFFIFSRIFRGVSFGLHPKLGSKCVSWRRFVFFVHSSPLPRKSQSSGSFLIPGYRFCLSRGTALPLNACQRAPPMHPKSFFCPNPPLRPGRFLRPGCGLTSSYFHMIRRHPVFFFPPGVFLENSVLPNGAPLSPPCVLHECFAWARLPFLRSTVMFFLYDSLF